MVRRAVFSGSPYEAQVGYARAVRSGEWVFVAGTVGRDPETGAMPDDITDQCANALAIIGRALGEVGADFADVVRVTYYVLDPAEFIRCAHMLKAAFGANPPAATMIIAGLIDPAMQIEIEVTAHLDPDRAIA